MCGPSWLSEPLSISQEETHPPCTDEESEPIELVCAAVNPSPLVFEFERWSAFSKAQRVVAWVLRFIHNCMTKDNKISGPLSVVELDKAKVKMFHQVQRDMYPLEIKALLSDKPLPKGSKLSSLDPFLDDEGLLRIKGRLENAELSFSSKHLVILPKCRLANLLVKFQSA